MHRLTKLPVAVKVVFKDPEENVCLPDLPEVALTNKLSSKYNIVRHIEHFEVGQFIYLVQACMSQGDLRSFIKAHGYQYLTEQELRTHAKSMVLALSGIHKIGFLHNDVQPSSFLVHCQRDARKAFTVKLGTLSHARPINAKHLDQDLNESQIEGLDGLYKAPEVILSNGEDTSTASDVWSLGITLFVLTTGEFPFKTYSDVIRDDGLNFSQAKYNVTLSNSFKNLIEGMLQYESRARMTLSQILEHEWVNQTD